MEISLSSGHTKMKINYSILLLLFMPGLSYAGSIEDTYGAIGNIMEVFAGTLGLYLFIKGLHTLFKNSEDPRTYTAKAGNSAIFSGILLMSSTYVFAMLGNSFSSHTKWDSDRSFMDVTGGIESLDDNGGKFFFFVPGHLETLLIGFLMLLGIASFLKGLYLVYEEGQKGPGSAPGGTKSILVHLVSGLLLFRATSISLFASDLIGT